MMTQITKSNNHDQGEGELWQKNAFIATQRLMKNV